MGFDVPVRVHVTRAGLLYTSRLDLLEAPLWEVDRSSSEITPKLHMSESECRGQSSDTGAVGRGGIADHLDLPVVLLVTNGSVAVARYFPVSLGNWGGNSVRVEVSTGLGVEESNDLLVCDEAQRCFGIKLRLTAVRPEEPVVIGILVVVAGNLLLATAFRVCLDVRMEQATTIAHVLDGHLGSHGDLEWRVFADFGATEVRLEEGRHLSIAGARVLED